MAEQRGQRVIFDSHVVTGKLASQRAGLDVALRANLQRDFAFGKEVHQRRIMDRSDSMADALHSEQFDGFADFFRAADLAGVHQQMQSNFGRALVHGAKCRRGHLQFVAPDAKGDNRIRRATPCGFHDGHRRLRAELPHRVKNPPETQAPALERFGGAKHSFKACFRPLPPQKHNADGQRHFGVNDILRQQLLRELRGGQGVVLRLAQKRCEPLKRLEELREIAEGITLAHLLLRCTNVVTRHQRERRGRLNSALQVQMKFGLGKGIDSRRERRRGHPQN